MIILIHSSKTMRSAPDSEHLRQPALVEKSRQLDAFLKTLSPRQLQTAMHISPALAEKTHALIQNWHTEETGRLPAIDSFIGDIYSGLRAGEFSKSERDYADKTLWILSGLYGFLRPYDGIRPYRLEMGYKFPDSGFEDLYRFWGDNIAEHLPKNELIVNTSSIEYSRVITPYVSQENIITPNFLTIDPRTGVPKFTAVHAKIARGAFARWLITTKVTDPQKFSAFSELGYRFDSETSTQNQPVFVCKTFGGKGLSIRLNDAPTVA